MKKWLVALLLVGWLVSPVQARKPNILFIFTDDQAPWSVHWGCRMC